ncbi:PEGA domain-containing protein, partial [Candidatus Saccharibacteria bacterium]|nr:PEGA domain-containing protein [Candidatus Saccharibacteria bacterium]
MDYLDTKKERRHSIILFTGYICIAIAIALTAIILLYQAYGFGVTRKGDVTQNGLLFFSSQPNPANISVNGKLTRYTTNTRLSILSGVYKFEITRDGYRNWERMIEVEGGAVQHFDYPFLIPSKLSDKKIKTFATAPRFTTQSPDRRWLVVLQP